VLVVEDGKSLVRARYAVRNNQRSLLSVALPPGATLWSTVVAGRPVRPGRSNTGALLIPLEKARSRNDLPAFVVELLYVSRIPRWADKGTSDVTLPAVDLPISRTGLVLHHSPRFRVVPTPGAFHIEPYVDAFSGVLRDDDRRPIDVAAASPDEAADTRDKDAVMKELVRQYQKADGGRSVPGVVPIHIPFPEFGPVVFLAAELTPETKAAVVAFEYERVKSN
jgi:hypothetical protein